VGYDITSALTVYGGGYYFDHSNVKSIAGPKFRATYTFYRSNTHRLLRLFDRIRLEGLISHDSVRGTSWLAGIRFSFGLSAHATNPTIGVARHMVDPIRRDLNVISNNFNNLSLPYRIDGDNVTVDLVSNASGRTINDAVDGVDTAAEVIIVRGDHAATAGTNLELGSRDLDITGGEYSFKTGGHSYTVSNSSGSKATLTSASGEDLFDLSGGTSDIVLENISLMSADDDTFAVINSGGDSIGQVTVNHVTSTAPIDFKLTQTSATGEIIFKNNTLNLTDSMAIDGDVSQFAGVIFMLDDASQQLDVSNFSYNKINLLNRAGDSTDVNGLYVSGVGGQSVEFSSGMSSNRIKVNNNDIGGAVDAIGFYSNNVLFDESVIDNTFMASGNGQIGTGWLSESSSDLTIQTSLSRNKFEASDNIQFGYGWYTQGSVIVQNDLKYNTFTVSGNGSFGTGGSGWFSEDSVSITGSMCFNTLNASHNGGDAYGWRVGNSVSISNGIYNNNFRALYNDGDAYAWSNGTSDTLTIVGDMYDNTFNASYNTYYGYGWTNNDIDISNDFRDNTFIALQNGESGGEGYGWFSAGGGGTISISGDMRNNIFRVSDVDGGTNNEYGWQDISNVAIAGAVKNNVMRINGNANTFGFEFEVNTGETVEFGEAVTGNSLLINGNSSGDYGFELNTNGGNGTIDFNGNSSEAELIQLNYNAGVNDNGGANINYNG